ncbi:MAG: choline/ethanolamine kinase family protein [Thalassolituus sp.]
MNTILEPIMKDWPTWALNSEPILVRELTGGLTNKSYLLQSGERFLVLRINHPNSVDLDIDRHSELTIHHMAAAAKLSPAIIYSDPDSRYWVRDYINGNPLSDLQISPAHLDQMARLLNQLHRLTLAFKTPITRTPITRLDISHKVNHYLQQTTPNEEVHQLRQSLSALMYSHSTQTGEKTANCLCHMDPLPANWIEASNGKLWLLDWEYSAWANPALDYAALWLHIPEALRSHWEGLHPELSPEQKQDAINTIQLLEQSWYLGQL